MFDKFARTARGHRLGLALLSLALLSGCSSLDLTRRLDPYRMDVRQGNLVTQDMVAQLKPGLSRDQVRFILGTPLVVDVFHKDRWDYVYRLQSGTGEVQSRRLAVFFKDDKLVRTEGDVLPNPNSGASAPNSR